MHHTQETLLGKPVKCTSPKALSNAAWYMYELLIISMKNSDCICENLTFSHKRHIKLFLRTSNIISVKQPVVAICQGYVPWITAEIL